MRAARQVRHKKRGTLCPLDEAAAPAATPATTTTTTNKIQERM